MEKTLWYAMPIGEVLKELEATPQGLSREEAARRLERYGPNTLKEEKRISPWEILLGQFKNFLILLLIAATVISVLLGETLDAIVIFAIVIASAVLGFYQEYRAEKALQALKAMASPTASVLRNGEEVEIPSAEVVPGDIMLLTAGDRMPADGRLIEAANVRIDEASLTGESTAVEKVAAAVLAPETGIGDRKNLVFAATVMTYGRGRAVVTATGMETEFGRIAKMLQEVEEEPSPLAVRMDYIGKRLGAICLAVSALVMGLGIARGNPVLEMFIWGVSLAIAAVPEALAAVVTGALAIGVQRAARRKAIVRRLPAVETLGCTTVICSDKTGTLTKNEMTIRQMYAGGRTIEVGGVGFEPAGEFLAGGKALDPLADATLKRLLVGGAICNDSHLLQAEAGWRIKGDPTEGALVVAAAKAALDPEELRLAWPRVGEIPFESERKRMSTVHREPGGDLTAFVKGAPELVVERCTHWERQGKREPLTPELREEILAVNDQMAQGALRVLGVATRSVGAEASSYTPDGLEVELTFLGLVGMIDPPRDEVKLAIRQCREAGIRSVMVTGDHKLTAAAIARELGLLEGDGKGERRVLEGRELDRMSEEELAGIVQDVAVYARVSPEHKMKIVGAWKSHRHVVAMTGDGVNDAPALKRADIGIAMGITGTDVTKEASDMVLMDDNFATIVAAVEEGRIIYDNIKKYLSFLLSCNVAEILVLGLAGFIGWPLPLVALQILWVNLTTDGLPALALGVEAGEPDLMRRKPRDPGEPVFSRPVLIFLGTLSLLIFAGMVPIFYLHWQWEGVEKARTMALATLITYELFYAFNCRSLRFTLPQLGFFSNRWLVLAVLSSALLMIAVIYIPSWSTAFHTVPLSLVDWDEILLVAGGSFLLVEVGKWVAARRRPAPVVSGA
ncbi:MAG: cation-translocating P-type ATPase [candidate division NC10 bacterium]|nr:cation-translocating P-type ATPase [candidate division NC10 bacterium]